jgi:lysophospholipase L1-like esterase
VGKVDAARKLATAAAVGGGGLSVLGGALYGVLTAEARLARRIIGKPSGDPPDPAGWYARRFPGPAIRIAILGDSGAAGYGVERIEQTPGALVASGIAEVAQRPVYLRSFAIVGTRSSGLDAQLDRALTIEPHLAVILIGANDVTHKMPPSQSVRFLGEAVRRLRMSDVRVVVGTCPDLGTVKPIAPPLRQVARAWSRRLAAAQTIAVVEAGGRTLSLGSVLGPEFDTTPHLFGADRFHPSAEGYRAMADVLLPSLLAELDLLPEEPATAHATETLPVATAAVRAVGVPGTELDGADLDGAGGLRGRWVRLRRRSWRSAAAAAGPEMRESPASEDTGDSTGY